MLVSKLLLLEANECKLSTEEYMYARLDTALCRFYPEDGKVETRKVNENNKLKSYILTALTNAQ